MILLCPFQSPGHTPSVSPVWQASHSLSTTSHIKPSSFTPLLLRHQDLLVHQCLLFGKHLQSPLLLSPSGFTRSSVSPVCQASSITPPVKPLSFIRSSVSPVRQASSITPPVKPSGLTRSSVSPVWQASSITPPVKPSGFTRSSVSPVRQPSSITPPVKPSGFTRSSVFPVRSKSHSPSTTSLVRNSPISTSNPDSPTLILPPSQILPKSSVSNEQSLLLLCPAQTSNSHQDDIPSPVKPPLAKRTSSDIRLVL